jgi:hypothetical protein
MLRFIAASAALAAAGGLGAAPVQPETPTPALVAGLGDPDAIRPPRR